MGGAYLSKPILEKVSSKGSNEKVVFGASSMQGWRESQEDAHNCVLDFDDDACLFAVYDGHGGSEVSKYTAQNLPEFLKQRKSYADKNYKDALIEAFLEFDDKLITEEAATELKKLITPPKKVCPWKRLDEISMDVNEGPSTSSDDVVEENISELQQEAQMPISEVIIKKYPGAQEMLMKKLGPCDNPPSPYLRARCGNQAGPSDVSSSKMFYSLGCGGAGTSKMANLPCSTSEENVQVSGE